MLGLLRRASRSAPQQKPRPQPDTVVYAVGDVHGRSDLLRQLRAKILAHPRPDTYRAVVVYLGDYVDRGPDSKGVIDMLAGEPLPGCDEVFLVGNHEHWLLRFLDDPVDAAAWLSHGGAAALASYGIDADPGVCNPLHLRRLRDEFARALPRQHLEFLGALRPSYEAGDYVFVHAGIQPGVPLGEQDRRDLLWIRDDFLKSKVRHEKVVVHGHSVVSSPEVLPNRICVDTGAYSSGKLTALVLLDDAQDFLVSEAAGA